VARGDFAVVARALCDLLLLQLLPLVLGDPLELELAPLRLRVLVRAEDLRLVHLLLGAYLRRVREPQLVQLVPQVGAHSNRANRVSLSQGQLVVSVTIAAEA
jgi:hypothetical protein